MYAIRSYYGMKTQKLILLFFACFLASCAAATRLPGGAEAALIQYWRNLPAGGHNFEIVRAWPGLFPVEGYPGDEPRLEVWCVRITSYNVCYTKLLRRLCVYTCTALRHFRYAAAIEHLEPARCFT